jgi:hypothetical protein
MKTRSPYLNYIADYMLTHQYSLRTINAYLGWITNFIHFHNKRHPTSMGDAEVEAFLDHNEMHFETLVLSFRIFMDPVTCLLAR